MLSSLCSWVPHRSVLSLRCLVSTQYRLVLFSTTGAVGLGVKCVHHYSLELEFDEVYFFSSLEARQLSYPDRAVRAIRVGTNLMTFPVICVGLWPAAGEPKPDTDAHGTNLKSRMTRITRKRADTLWKQMKHRLGMHRRGTTRTVNNIGSLEE